MPAPDFRFEGKPIIGMVHLAPLPGSPRWAGSMDEVVDLAARDATTLAAEGIDALLVENYGDVPFYPAAVPPVTVASMAVVLTRLMRESSTGLPWGVNVLRNDAAAALSLAAAVGASFVRVNVHGGASATDQGVIEGKAHETLRLRAALAPKVAILADARVKHGSPLHAVSLEEEVSDLTERALADAVLITGPCTGKPPEEDEVRAAAAAAGPVPVMVASGISAANVGRFLPLCRGIIVGTALKRGGRTESPVDRDRLRDFLAAARGTRP